ncbi:MAG: hypothetical protein ACJAT4_003374 [Granulosicoccus sp.]|jgi:hypothetical protein
MKNLNLNFYLILSILFLASCSDQQKEEVNPNQIDCNLGCLFVMENIEGTMIYMDCFQKYAIQTQYPDDQTITIYGIPESVSEEFEEEGKQIIFTATFRENTLVPQFPDPSFNMASLYEIELISIK